MRAHENNQTHKDAGIILLKVIIMLKSILNIPLATAFAQSNIDAVDDSTALNITQALHYHYV